MVTYKIQGNKLLKFYKGKWRVVEEIETIFDKLELDRRLGK